MYRIEKVSIGRWPGLCRGSGALSVVEINIVCNERTAPVTITLVGAVIWMSCGLNDLEGRETSLEWRKLRCAETSEYDQVQKSFMSLAIIKPKYVYL